MLEELKIIISLNQQETKKINDLINQVINEQITNEDYISIIFDQILSLTFVNRKTISRLFNKLLKYTLTFNEPLANDYEKIYQEELQREDLDNRLLLGQELHTNQDPKILFEKYQIEYNPQDIPYLIELSELSTIIPISYELSWLDYRNLLSLGDTHQLNCYLERVKSHQEPISTIRAEWERKAYSLQLIKTIKGEKND